MKYYFAQLLGIVAFTVAVLSFQQRSQKRIVTFQLISSCFFTAHFLLLGVYVGFLMNALGAFRAIVFANKDKAWARSRVWLFVFVALFTAAGIITIDNDLDLTTWNVDFTGLSAYISLLPIFGMIFTTVAFWAKDAATVRKLSAPSCPFWLTYNLYNRSWGGVATEVFALCSIIIGMIRLDIRRKENGVQN